MKYILMLFGRSCEATAKHVLVLLQKKTVIFMCKCFYFSEYAIAQLKCNDCIHSVLLTDPSAQSALQ